nr:GAF domain-containing protein [Angustibacter aerolatus]
MHAVVEALARSRTADDAVQTALDVVREQFGWAYASCWRLDEAAGVLRVAAESGEAGEAFRAVTRTATFAEGVGLSGRAWRTRDLVLVADLAEPARLRAGTRRAAQRHPQRRLLPGRRGRRGRRHHGLLQRRAARALAPPAADAAQRGRAGVAGGHPRARRRAPGEGRTGHRRGHAGAPRAVPRRDGAGRRGPRARGHPHRLRLDVRLVLAGRSLGRRAALGAGVR